MNIAFDAVALLGAMSKNRGIGNYALSQFKTILEQDTENNYFFFNIFDEQAFFSKEIDAGRVQEDDFLCIKDGYFIQADGMEELYGALISNYIQRNRIDVFYITSPFEDKVPVYQKNWFGDCAVVVTVYDIIPYVFEKQYFPKRSDMAWYLERLEVLNWADRLVVISQSVKDDLMHYLHLPGDKIDVIWGAVGPQFTKSEVADAEKTSLFKRFGIDSPYIMCTGGDDARKNISGLIKAFGMLSEELRERYQLVIVCKLQPSSVARYTELAQKCGIAGRVVLTNFVSDRELVQLYNLALLVAFPSRYEGFGLPVVEAWACGKPVLTSNNSSLVQIAGDAAILVDPFSEESVSKGLKSALTETDLDALARKGEERLALFQWKNVAEETVRSFIKAREQHFVPEASGSASPVSIAYFSPLPPLQSGISDYSVDILSELAKYFDIDVYIDKGYQADCALPENVTVYPARQYESRRRKYRSTVYQLGNSEFHVYMWPFLQKYSGVAVLHDYNMHGVVSAKTLNRDRDFKAYEAILRQDVDAEAASACVNAIKNGDWSQLFKIELNSFLIDHSDKVIVHSREAMKKLLRKNIGRSVTQIRHYAKILPLPDKKKARRELGIDENDLVFAAFGFVHENKRIIPILEAFAKLHAAARETRLVFVGKMDAALDDRFYRRLHELKLEDCVKVTGYTDLEEFLRWIDATDVCLNLRYPYNGETSGSLMRILAKGKCVVVNDIGSFSEIPDEACIKLPPVSRMNPNEEVRRIHEAMSLLAADAQKRQELQHNARQFAEENLDLKLIGAQYRDVILTPKSKAALTEKTLSALKDAAASFTDEQRSRLAHTLAYAAVSLA